MQPVEAHIQALMQLFARSAEPVAITQRFLDLITMPGFLDRGIPVASVPFQPLLVQAALAYGAGQPGDPILLQGRDLPDEGLSHGVIMFGDRPMIYVHATRQVRGVLSWCDGEVSHTARYTGILVGHKVRGVH